MNFTKALSQLSRNLFFVLTVVSLCACGFHLRGQTDIPKNKLSSSYFITFENVSAYVERELTQKISQQMMLVPQMDDAKFQLVLTSEKWQKRVLSVARGGVPLEYRLTYLLNYTITDSSGKLLSAKLLIAERDFAVQNDKILSHDSEVQQIKSDLQNRVISQLLTRLFL